VHGEWLSVEVPSVAEAVAWLEVLVAPSTK
jgi:hypothetical protein